MLSKLHFISFQITYNFVVTLKIIKGNQRREAIKRLLLKKMIS